MAKSSKRFVCNGCGAVQLRWMGKCPDCGEWDSLEELLEVNDKHTSNALPGSASKAVPISEVGDDDTPTIRIATTIGELDRVLGGTTETDSGQTKGGGIVPGSAILIGGDPGIGKSTLLLQAADKLARNSVRVLYVTSEESAQQLRMRAERLSGKGKGPDDLYVLADTNLARVMEQIRKTQPIVVIIDSIQMIHKSDLSAAPGSMSQLRSCCLELVHMAKASNTAVFMVGHVTKEGRLAGPRLLEHMVDTVLNFEGDRYHSHRIVRAVKNRFGTTLEVGLFEMSQTGLTEVTDGSKLLAAEYEPRNGSVVCPVLHGTRCLLVEVQALTATGFLGAAKRKASGLDSNRLAMLIAVLEKRGELRLADQDIFTSVVGGLKVAEPAADLAISLAISGAHLNRSLTGQDKGVCAIGEVGLGGEIRHVQQFDQRVSEAVRLGFTDIIAPASVGKTPRKCRLHPVRRIEDALEMLH